MLEKIEDKYDLEFLR
ncbi:TPA: hypothetical protein ACGO1E_001741 [Streptococcus suis]